MSTPDMSRPSSLSNLNTPQNSDQHSDPDRLKGIEDNLTTINKTLVAFGEFAKPMAHPAAPEALKATIVAGLRMQGKYKEANELEGTKEETGISGYLQKSKQWANVPLTPTSQLKVVGGVGLAAIAWDFVLGMADSSLPQTGALGVVKGIFGGNSKKR